MTDQEKDELHRYTDKLPVGGIFFLRESDVQGYIAMKKKIWEQEGRNELYRELINKKSNS